MKVECPRCFSQKTIMQGTKYKGFKYIDCNFCDSDGLVDEDLSDDWDLSQDEDKVENYD